VTIKKFREAITDEAVVTISTKLEEKFYNKRIIFLQVARLDYTKGVNYRLDAYESFLEQHPEWRREVVFIMNVIHHAT
jgi:trehalose 6-phosphate synthase/phosphatase